MRFVLLLLFLCFFLTPFHVHAEDLNAGFVQGLWYSTPTVFAQKPVRIYVALRNNTDHDLTGTVRFTDNETRIGTSYVSALPGRLVEGWVDWVPVYGEHKIVATLTDVKLHIIGESAQNADAVSTLAEDTLTIDYDTDGDGIGNAIDTDDDNDTISDVDEIAQNTDPLIANPKKQEGTQSTEPNSNAVPEPEKKEVALPQIPNSAPGNGLEQYVPPGTINTILQKVTEKVTGAKTSLDEYRAGREDTIGKYISNVSKEATGTIDTILSSPIGEATTTVATITRSRIKDTDTGFLHAIIGGGKALISGVYTFTLWLVSNALAHPAILELVLLVGILYFIYRTARKFGRRPRN